METCKIFRNCLYLCFKHVYIFIRRSDLYLSQYKQISSLLLYDIGICITTTKYLGLTDAKYYFISENVKINNIYQFRWKWTFIEAIKYFFRSYFVTTPRSHSNQIYQFKTFRFFVLYPLYFDLKIFLWINRVTTYVFTLNLGLSE